uniref:FAD-linked oxidoreductase janO n=1 Tax=Penicillium janthinellum TaxID=5079 RepID=JANO_PENJA|nr:RecName: Full=FAD-linked oxidoreductase janO; AltName: Full=Janthitremanes biosynthesis cluster protein O [Penicillium janthinellum]AGZ20488.1 putative FAD-binding oxidoreductase [Penicillium janthinellum]
MTIPELPILWRDNAPPSEYEAWRSRTFNSKRPDAQPLAIIKPTTIDHIVSATALAKENNAKLALRSGGHSLQCWSLRKDSILVDLENFRYLEFDDATGVVSVTPSVTSSELLLFLANKKRFFPSGHSGEVGLGGFLLQGGIGLNARSYGYACEYLTAVDVVTVSGEVKHCSPDENADLFWAARGAGPEFPAIVTRFHLNTRPLLPTVKRCTYIWPAVCYEMVFKWVLEILPTLSDDIEPTIFGFTLPNTPIPVIAFHAHVHAESDESAIELLKPLHESHPAGAMVEQDCVDTSVQQEFESGHAIMPPGARYFTDSVFLTPGTDIIEACREMFTTLPAQAAGSIAYWEPMKQRTKLPEMAWSIHSEHYVSLMAIYGDQNQDHKQQTWILDCFKDMDRKGLLLGTYVGDAHPKDRPHHYWSDPAKERIQKIGVQWDPEARLRGTIFAENTL